MKLDVLCRRNTSELVRFYLSKKGDETSRQVMARHLMPAVAADKQLDFCNLGRKQLIYWSSRQPDPHLPPPSRMTDGGRPETRAFIRPHYPPAADPDRPDFYQTVLDLVIQFDNHGGDHGPGPRQLFFLPLAPPTSLSHRAVRGRGGGGRLPACIWLTGDWEGALRAHVTINNPC